MAKFKYFIILFFCIVVTYVQGEICKKVNCKDFITKSLRGTIIESYRNDVTEIVNAICNQSQCRDWLEEGDTWCDFWYNCKNRCIDKVTTKLKKMHYAAETYFIDPCGEFIDLNDNREEICTVPPGALDLDPCVPYYYHQRCGRWVFHNGPKSVDCSLI